MYKLTTGGIVLDTETGKYISPGNGTQADETFQAWLAEGNMPDPADQPPPPDYSAMRANDYREESDPLFFKSQRGEATSQEWLDKVAEIKARWPE